MPLQVYLILTPHVRSVPQKVSNITGNMTIRIFFIRVIFDLNVYFNVLEFQIGQPEHCHADVPSQ